MTAVDGALVDEGTGLDGLLDDARVPLDRIHAELDAVERRVRRLGDSARPVHQARHLVARHVGDATAARREFELWIGAGSDLSSGCAACERGMIGDWHAERGDDARAFEAWDALIGGELFCDAEPHRTLSRSLIPLVRLGRADQARANHLNGYRISRLKPSMSGVIGEHIEFCALTGNAARGLELLAEHGHWLAGRRDSLRRAGFLGGVEVLLRVLTESGFEDLPFAVAGGARVPLGELREQVEQELAALVARFDERSRTTAFSRRLVQRRSRQPFLSSLPLPARTTLPRPGRRGSVHPARVRPRPIDELVAEARRLTLMWHPGALDAWRRVQAAAQQAGRPLAEDAQVELDEQLLIAQDDAASPGQRATDLHARLLRIAERYRALGRPGPALRAASRAAFALCRAGQPDEAASEQAGLRLAAADALAGREITPREYMAVRIGSGYQRFHAWTTAASGAAGREAESVAAAAREALEELDELVDECRRFRLSVHGATTAAMAAQVHLGRGAAEAAEERLRLAVELYTEGGAPWSAAPAELKLSRIERSRGNLAAAQRYAAAAVEHNLDPALRGPAAMMLAETIWLQDGREGDAIAPALAAAAAFARQEGAAHEEARARARAAEALAVVGRHDEAIALFEPALRVLEDRSEQDEWKPVIGQAARAYGNSLMAVGEHRRAAEVLLKAAERVAHWPNQLPHAMTTADAATALERAGRPREAAAAFQRAADLWQRAGEPFARVACLRSAARLLAPLELSEALALADRAGSELVESLAGSGQDVKTRRRARLELAETHAQRARMVVDLADEGLLPEEHRAPLIEQARQEIAGAISGLRRLIAADHGDGGGGHDGGTDGTGDRDDTPAHRLDAAMTVLERLGRHRVRGGAPAAQPSSRVTEA